MNRWLEYLHTCLDEDWYDDSEKYSLVGQNGNAFALMGYTAKCMKECGLRDEVKEMQDRAMSGDYNNLIRVCDEYVQRCNKIAYEEMYESYKLREAKLNEDALDDCGVSTATITDLSKNPNKRFFIKTPEGEQLLTGEDLLYYFDGYEKVKVSHIPGKPDTIISIVDESYKLREKFLPDRCEVLDSGYCAKDEWKTVKKEQEEKYHKQGYKDVHCVLDRSDTPGLRMWVTYSCDSLYNESYNKEVFTICKVGDHEFALGKGNPPIINARKTIEADSYDEAKEILMNNGYSESELVFESYSNKEIMNAVKWTYGFTNKEAKEFIKKTDKATLEEIVNGYQGNAKKSFLTDSYKLREKREEPELYDKPGEYWYFTKHGVGPGSVPRGIDRFWKIINADGGEYFLIKDKILSTSALNNYEIKEKWPPEYLLDESLNEDFWNPGPEFEEFVNEYHDGDDDWNNWNQNQRDAYCERVAKEYLKVNPNPSQEFFDDLEDCNFHSEFRAFRKLLGESYRLNEKRWSYDLKSGYALRQAIRSENYADIIKAIYACYEELRDNGIIDEDEFEDYTADFEMYMYDDFEDWEDPEDVINYELNDLYDLCDNVGVWIPINESLGNKKMNESRDFYFGKEKAEQYGDIIEKALSGKTVSKSKAKAEEPGGLIYEANKLGIDMWDLLEALEGMCYQGRCREIDDSTYLVGNNGKLTESVDLDVDSLTFDEMLDLWWEMNGMAACYDMEMEPDEIDAYFKEHPDELEYNIKEGLPFYDDEFVQEWMQNNGKL